MDKNNPHWNYFKKKWDNRKRRNREHSSPPEEKKKPDSIQRQINNNLDNIINTRREIIKLKKDKSLSAAQKNNRTETLNSEIKQFESKLNKITNEGTQIKGIFNNPYYINDIFEDKRCNS